MALPSDAIALNQQNNGLPPDAIALNQAGNSGNTYAQAASQMPGGQATAQNLNNPFANSPLIPIGPGRFAPNPGYMKQTDIPANVAGAYANIAPKAQETMATGQATENLAGQKSAARDMATMNLLTGMFRGMTDNYAKAYKGGLAGGVIQSKMGDLADQGYDLFNWANKDALKGVGGFEAVRNEGITRFNSMYSEQLGGAGASSRIFTTLLNLAHKELPDRVNPIPSVEGRIEGSMQNLTRMVNGSVNYLTQLHSSQDLANASPNQLDTWTQQAMKKSNDYQIDPDVMDAVKQRVSYINQPLEDLSGKQSHQDIAKQILQERLKNGQ